MVHLFHANSTTNAGGIGIHIKCRYNPCIYDNASHIHDSEYISIKLQLEISDYIFGVVYHHLIYSSENFQNIKNSFDGVIEHFNSIALLQWFPIFFDTFLLSHF